MPGITDVETLPSDSGSDPSQTFDRPPEYPSPDGEWLLRFSDQWELRMGLLFWRKTQLSHHGRDVSAEQHLSSSLGHGATPVTCYVPWNVSGDKVLISTLHSTKGNITSGYIIQDVALGFPSRADEDFWLRGAVWSPHDDLMLLVTEKACRVVTGEGDVVTSIDNALGWSRAVAAGWTPNGGSFFCAGPSDEASTALRFFDPRSGHLIDQVALKPRVLVPYDDAEYASLNRDGYCLSMASGARGVGRLLDDWSGAMLDPENNRLVLAVFRPTSTVQPLAPRGKELGEPVLGCTVEKRWISIRVVD